MSIDRLAKVISGGVWLGAVTLMLTYFQSESKALKAQLSDSPSDRSMPSTDLPEGGLVISSDGYIVANFVWPETPQVSTSL